MIEQHDFPSAVRIAHENDIVGGHLWNHITESKWKGEEQRKQDGERS